MLTLLMYYAEEVDSMREHRLHLNRVATQTTADMQKFRSRIARFLDFSIKARNLDILKSVISKFKSELKYFSIIFKSNKVHL